METFPRYWIFVHGIHLSPVNSPHKGQWRGALMFSLICAWINGWVNNRKPGDLRRHRAHYDAIVMVSCISNDKTTHIRLFAYSGVPVRFMHKKKKLHLHACLLAIFPLGLCIRWNKTPCIRWLACQLPLVSCVRAGETAHKRGHKTIIIYTLTLVFARWCFMH